MMQKKSIPPLSRPTWVEIHLKNLARNFHSIKRWTGKNIAVMGIVKADAYGHGAVRVAKTLQKEGIDYFGVASLYEAKEIYDAGIRKPVLILGHTPPEYLKDVAQHNFRQTVFDAASAQKLNDAASRMKKPVAVHVKVDTGMGRLGLFPEHAAEFIRKIKTFPFLKIEGVFTHFSSADQDAAYTKKQLLKFHAVLRQLKEANIAVPYIHAANSAALLNFKDSHFNMTRPGILLYGLSPLPQTKKPPFALSPVLSLKSRIISIKKFPANAKVSYSGTHATRRNEKIAVVPIGYADGYLRALSNRSIMLVHGKKVPVVGQVCMDFTLLNVSRISGVCVQDEVTVIGQSGAASISVNDLAHLANTINYEITCLIGKRVPRVYL